MKSVLFIFTALLSIAVMAKETKKKYLGPIESPPGGARADHALYKQWEGMIRHQKFPMLVHSSKLEKDQNVVFFLVWDEFREFSSSVVCV
jgi:hypothetical protein